MKSITLKLDLHEADEQDWVPENRVWAEVLRLFLEWDLDPGPEATDRCEYQVVIYGPEQAKVIRDQERLEHLPLGEWGWHDPGLESYGALLYHENGKLWADEQ